MLTLKVWTNGPGTYRQSDVFSQVGRGVYIQVETVFGKLERNALLPVGEKLREHLPANCILGAPGRGENVSESTRQTAHVIWAWPRTERFEPRKDVPDGPVTLLESLPSMRGGNYGNPRVSQS